MPVIWGPIWLLISSLLRRKIYFCGQNVKCYDDNFILCIEGFTDFGYNSIQNTLRQKIRGKLWQGITLIHLLKACLNIKQIFRTRLLRGYTKYLTLLVLTVCLEFFGTRYNIMDNYHIIITQNLLFVSKFTTLKQIEIKELMPETIAPSRNITMFGKFQAKHSQNNTHLFSLVCLTNHYS